MVVVHCSVGSSSNALAIFTVCVEIFISVVRFYFIALQWIGLCLCDISIIHVLYIQYTSSLQRHKIQKDSNFV